MDAISRYIRDTLRGPSFASLFDLYRLGASRLTGLLSLPLPFLSFLALPFYAGGSTTVNLLFFYLTWSTLVIGHDQLTVELFGIATVRLLCFLLPALAFLAFDCAIPKVSKTIKARGEKQLPLALGRDRLVHIVSVSV